MWPCVGLAWGFGTREGYTRRSSTMYSTEGSAATARTNAARSAAFAFAVYPASRRQVLGLGGFYLLNYNS